MAIGALLRPTARHEAVTAFTVRFGVAVGCSSCGLERAGQERGRPPANDGDDPARGIGLWLHHAGVCALAESDRVDVAWLRDGRGICLLRLAAPVVPDRRYEPCLSDCARRRPGPFCAWRLFFP